MLGQKTETDIDIQGNKKEFDELLRQVGREGTDYLIEDLENLGFYEAPASTRFHLCHDGGLVAHSLNVCHAAVELRKLAIKMHPFLEPLLNEDSAIVASLLHDVCKADVYKKAVKRRKDHFGVWQDVPGYDVDYSNFPMGHGEKSAIVVLRSGYDIHDDELLAIRWHMTAWNLPFQDPEARNSLNAARNKYPLCSLVSLADNMASGLLEWGTGGEDDTAF